MPLLPNVAEGAGADADGVRRALREQFQNQRAPRYFGDAFRVMAFAPTDGSRVLLFQARGQNGVWKTVAALDTAGRIYFASAAGPSNGVDFSAKGWNPTSE